MSRDGSLSSGNSHDSHRLDTWRGVLKGGPVELDFTFVSSWLASGVARLFWIYGRTMCSSHRMVY